MKNLLIETVFPALVLHEEQGGPLRISGIASETNKPNRNGRVYPRAVMEREVAKMREDLDNSSRVGLIDHPDASPSVGDLALKFTDLRLEGDTVYFDAEVIPTQKGRDLEAVIRAGVRVGISSRGYGSAKVSEWQGQRVSLIGEDFELESYDVVVTPSVANARVTQYESTVREALHRLVDAELERDLVPEEQSLTVIGKLEGTIPDLPTGDETPHAESCSVQADAIEGVANGETMNDTLALLERTAEMERRLAESAPVEAPETVVEETVVDEAVEESPEVVAEAAVVDETPVAAVEATVAPTAESAVATEPVVAAVAESTVVDDAVAAAQARIRDLTEQAERAAVAEARVAELERELAEARTLPADTAVLTERAVLAEAKVAELAEAVALLKEDAGIQMVLMALQSAMATELAEGDWDILASLAYAASNMEFLNHRDDANEGGCGSDCAICGAYEALQTPKGLVALDKALAPLKHAAERIERDRVAYESTADERYGRRMLALLRDECRTPAEVEAAVPVVRARVLAEATGQRVLPEIRGLLSLQERSTLTDEQRKQRRLAGYVD